jgi:hypothetical protein
LRAASEESDSNRHNCDSIFVLPRCCVIYAIIPLMLLKSQEVYRTSDANTNLIFVDRLPEHRQILYTLP